MSVHAFLLSAYLHLFLTLFFIFLLVMTSVTYTVSGGQKAVISARDVDALVISPCPAEVHMYLGIE